MYKKIILCVLVLSGTSLTISAATAATAPCGISGTLNVGVNQFNQPYSDFYVPTHTPFGFDLNLVLAIAQVLGYSVNFVYFVNPGTALAQAEAAINDGTIDIYANSAIPLTGDLLSDFQGLITDVSHVLDPAEPQAATTSPFRGYLFSQSCCYLIQLFEEALTLLVLNGTYANLLQRERGNPYDTNTNFMGLYSFTPTGPNKLVEPLPFNSSMAGTIFQDIASPTGLTGCSDFWTPITSWTPYLAGNCYVQVVPSICFTYTGASGTTGPVSGTGCFIP